MSTASNGEFAWARYALLALAIHGAILILPTSHKVTKGAEPAPIEIQVMRQEIKPVPPPVPEKTQPVARSPVPQKIEEKQKVDTPPPSPAQAPAKKEEAHAGGGNVLDADVLAQVRPGPGPGAGEGAAVSGLNAGGGRIGMGSGMSGTGTGTGSGAGKGQGSGKIDGSGSGTAVPTGPVEAGFGQPGGPQFETVVRPEYPFAARRLGKEGKVLLGVQIDEKGKLIKVDVLEATDQMFVQPAIEAVKKSTFLPARRNGVPFECRSTFSIPFGFGRR